MNRFLFVSAMAMALAFPAFAFASVISLSPTNVSVTSGKVFTVTVTANPDGAHIYTVRANLSFNPALVQVTNFTFAPKWFVLPMKGYDVTNNTTGVLIKTGGYPGGITAPTVLGTATFKAKATGSVHIGVTTKSLLYDASSKNTISGTQGSSSVVIAPVQAAKPITKIVPKTTPKATTYKPKSNYINSKKSTAKKAITAAATTSTKVATTTSTSTVAAAAAGAPAPTTNRNSLYFLAGALGIIAGLLVWRNRKLFKRLRR